MHGLVIDTNAPEINGPESRKRKRRKTSFADYQVYDDNYGDLEFASAIKAQSSTGSPTSLDTEQPDHDYVPRPPGAKRGRRKSTNTNPPTGYAITTREFRDFEEDEGEPAKKFPGVQNSAKRILEWLQVEELTLDAISQRLPKLSRAKVQTVLDVLRTTRLVRLVRRPKVEVTVQPEGGAGEPASSVNVANGLNSNSNSEAGSGASCEEFYQFCDGKTRRRPIPFDMIGRDLREKKQRIEDLKTRIAVLQGELNKPPESLQAGAVEDMVKHFMQTDRLLENDPLYNLVKSVLATECSRGSGTGSRNW